MIDADVRLGRDVRIPFPDLVNLFGCEIGDDSFIGPFVEITRGVVIGQRCKVESHSFLCDGLTLEDDVFLGHGVMFTNDLYPFTARQVVKIRTIVGKGASVGSNATVIAGAHIGHHAIVGAGAVVARSVDPLTIVVGNPARITRRFATVEELRSFIESAQATLQQ